MKRDDSSEVVDDGRRRLECEKSQILCNACERQSD